MAGRWYRESALATGPEMCIFSSPANVEFFPGNMELLLRWVLSTGSDRYAFVVSLLATVAVLLVVYRICRAVGQSRRIAMIAASTAITVPMLPNLAMTSYSDSLALLCLLLAVLFLLEWHRSELRDRGAAVAAGLSLGLAAGTKYSALAPIFVIALVAACLMVFSRRPGARSWARPAFVIVASALAGGAFWYLRNAIQLGNPFYPVSMLGFPGMPARALAGVLHPGFESPGWKWAAYPWVEFDYQNPFDEGVGPVFSAIAVVALASWWLVRGNGRRRRESSTSSRSHLSRCSWQPATSTLGMPLFPIVLSFVAVGDLLQWAATRSLARGGRYRLRHDGAGARGIFCR